MIEILARPHYSQVTKPGIQIFVTPGWDDPIIEYLGAVGSGKRANMISLTGVRNAPNQTSSTRSWDRPDSTIRQTAFDRGSSRNRMGRWADTRSTLEDWTVIRHTQIDL